MAVPVFAPAGVTAPDAPESGALITQAGERRSSRLESIRALAALAVLGSHVFAYSHGWQPVIFSGYLHRAVMAGGFGVQLFFALSGYLLYRAFARRDFGAGRVDLRRYALNRALRILPLYYAVVVVLLLFTRHGGGAGEWWRFLLFCEEFSARTAQTVDPPIWSLVVEIMFYALLPFLAWALARASRGSVARALGLLVAGAAALTVALHLLAPAPAVVWSFSLPETFYGFVPGMVLALVEVSWAGRLPGYLRGWAARSDTWVGAAVVIWLLVPLDYSLVYASTAADFLLLGACVLPLESKRLVRALDWRPLAAVGVVSYSLYLWHVPVIVEFYRHVPHGTGPLLLAAGPAALLVAGASYAVVERPALLFRSRWATASAAPAGPVREGPKEALLGLSRARTLWAAAAVGGIALAVRLVAIARTTPLHLGADPSDYDRIARLLASGHGFGPGLSPSGGPSAFRAPLYPVFLGGVYRLTSGSITAARLVEAVLGVVTVGLVWAAARLLWDRRVAWTAAVVAAVLPPLVVWSTSLLSESLYLPLEMFAVVAALMARKVPAHRLQWAAAAGLAGGLGVLARPNGTVLVLGLAALVAVPLSARPRSALVPAGALVAVAGVAVLPWLVRDYADFHRLVPVSTIDGFNLAGEYNAQAASSPYPEVYQWRPPSAVPALLPLFSDRRYNEATLDRRLWGTGEAYVKRHPTSLAEAYFWNTFRMAQLGGTREAVPDMAEAGFGRVAAWAGMLSFWALAALAAVGFCTRRVRRAPPALWVAPALLWLISAAFLGTSRIRAPIDPFLVLAAAAGALALADRLRTARAGGAVALGLRRRFTG